MAVTASPWQETASDKAVPDSYVSQLASLQRLTLTLGAFSGRFPLLGNIKREQSIWEVAGEVEHRTSPLEHPLAFDDLSQGGITSFPAPVWAGTA